jgi:hypothetical protein
MTEPPTVKFPGIDIELSKVMHDREAVSVPVRRKERAPHLMPHRLAQAHDTRRLSGPAHFDAQCGISIGLPVYTELLILPGPRRTFRWIFTMKHTDIAMTKCHRGKY